MQQSAEDLESVEHLAEPEVEHEWDYQGSYHHQTHVPSRGDVVLVVEHRERGEYAREEGRDAAAGKAPREHGDPPCEA